jgi:mono/diheme cytochrome c family protein
MRALRIVCGAILLATIHTSAAAQAPAKDFEDNCGMCHAIGGPPGGAPDLKDVTKRRNHTWLVRFILNPEETAKHDADAAALVKQYDGMVMPATDGATTERVEAVLRYIETASGASSSPAPAAAAADTRAPNDSAIAAGREWYDGRRGLAHRGPACVSCHRHDSIRGLGGGTLGPDLTRVHERLGGPRGVATWLKNPPTRVMRAVFRRQPLADEETLAIATMLADERATAAPSRLATRRFVALGVTLALGGLGLAAAIWSRRLRGVRRPLVAAARAGDER